MKQLLMFQTLESPTRPCTQSTLTVISAKPTRQSTIPVRTRHPAEGRSQLLTKEAGLHLLIDSTTRKRNNEQGLKTRWTTFHLELIQEYSMILTRLMVNRIRLSSNLVMTSLTNRKNGRFRFARLRVAVISHPLSLRTSGWTDGRCQAAGR